MTPLKVAVYGLGYVGSVTSACLADAGHQVYGIDVESAKVAQLNQCRPPVIEPGLEEIMHRVVPSGRLRGVDADDTADLDPDVHLVCVGTPSRANGSLDTTFVERVAEGIGAHLARTGRTQTGRTQTGRTQTVVFRSTMLPGTVQEVLVPILEQASGLVAGTDFGVAMCPEFLRETTAVADFFDPPFTVVGVGDPLAADAVGQLFGFLDRPLHLVDLRTAETIKYACNAFHAVKVAFANEIGRFARSSGADAEETMKVFCTDQQLNISPAYLRPGFAFGGSCLPKDLRAMVHRGRVLDLDLPLLSSVLPSNDQHLRHAIDLVLESAPDVVCLLGLAFKTGTDDLRESPYVRLAETLIGKGVSLRIWDPDLRPDRLVGGNRAYIESSLPHLARLLVSSAADAVRGADTCVIGTTHPDALAALAEVEAGNGASRIVDLSGGARGLLQEASTARAYVGVAW